MATLAVRNQNPGNLRNPATGGFRSFSDPVEGKAALYNDLTAKMTGTSTTGLSGKSSLLDFSKTYAPASDNNDPVQYAANLANKLGVSPDEKIGTLIPRIDDFASAVSSNEDPSVQYKATSPAQEQNNFPLTSQEDVQKTQDQQPTDLTASNGKGLGGNVLDVLGNVTGTQKLGQGLGYALSNALGSQDKVIEAQGNMQDTQTQLLQRIKEKKARGEDTTKLQGALDDLTKKIQEGAGNIENVGTGGISSGQVLGSALQTGATVLTAPSLIKAGLGVFGVGKTAAALGNAAPYVAQETGITEKVFSSLTRTEQLNLLGQTLKGAQLGDAEIISNAIKALQPTTGFLKGLIKNYAIPAGVAIVADRVLGSRLGSAAKTVTSGLIK